MPEVLAAVLASSDGEAGNRAWALFLEEYSPLLIRVARHLGGDHDAVMDRYAWVLDGLRHDNYRRLRPWAAEGRGKFTTWLVVVARRLCHDYYRHRYGRPQGQAPDAEARAVRRNLVDLIGPELDHDSIPGPDEPGADGTLIHRERADRLRAALERLDTADRMILRYRFQDDLPVPRIARMLGIGSPFVLYRRIDRILATLRRDLAAAGIEDAGG
jgi:RNA polymerase sigma factor (sigma-70 family)